ncbi:LrgB family protein [Malikia spinosa]|jgi:predicted murein hydrolase (TIGR00659 family)|uniref:LrgB family protein n=1 Tax=Malikia spinosa TaxID=86180 RepID=A0A2S9KCI3_9BURK|nr:LrgB family protein [Malikia spinosa]MYZ51188.1 LrgB family protein [Malikia spinosa]OGB73108.1 MAG: hypothetical protein A2486_11825 [Burkholderiales bacterium RIFOXYC12_FULL_65_23]PRD68169.1 hypothetical protein C6P61_12325 [Malikia spinosa]
MLERATLVWQHLAGSTLLWLALTLLAYQFGVWLQRRLRGHALANPVLVAVALLSALLLLSGTSYASYMNGAGLIHFLLGPATVALAIPLHANWPRLKSMAGPLLLVLLVASLVAVVSAWGLGAWLGAGPESRISLAIKSITTPIAMAVTERLGGLPALTAVLVIVTGIVGGLCAEALYRWLRIDDDAVRGFALGLAAHGLGTARAFQFSEQAGAFAALGMGLNGLLTSFALPWLLPWLERLLAR